jgi:hypothetical protein|tara:strand:+ start:510 stop:815 length:306 start_codon:yes stop_codon:yes gene_type:complete
LAHGGCPDEINSEDFRNIEILLSDGFIGNKAILLALSCLTTGNLNSKLKQTSTPYTIKDVLPSVHEYIIPPQSEEVKQVQVQNQLLSFMLSRPESKEHLKV